MASPDRTSTVRSLPAVVGRTENALRALLLRTLDGTPLAGYEEWVALNLVDRQPTHEGEGETGDVVDAVRRPLGLDRERAGLLLQALVTRGLLTADDASHAVTPDGARLLASVRPAVAEMTRRVTEGLRGQDLAVAIDVLDHLSARARQELATLTR